MPWDGLIQLSGEGLCSAALPWIEDAQAQQEMVAWIGTATSAPFVPDLAASNIDLERLLWIQLHTIQEQVRAAEFLLRSGAFGCVVVDCGDIAFASSSRTFSNKAMRWLYKSSWQNRLAMLARAHQTAVLLLTYDDAPASLGSMIGVRIRYARGEGVVLRNKTSLPIGSALLRIRRDPPDGVVFAKPYETTKLHEPPAALDRFAG